MIKIYALSATSGLLLCCKSSTVFTQQEPEFQIMHHHWSNFSKLACKYGRAASWADSDLPCVLVLGPTTPVSPTTFLQSLLQDYG